MQEAELGRHRRPSSARLLAALAGALRALRRAGSDARPRDPQRPRQRADRHARGHRPRAALRPSLEGGSRGRRTCRPSATGWPYCADDDLDVPLIEAVLERASAITRGDPGKVSDVQVLAANIDTVFVVHPIAEPPNLRRIERELSLAWDSGAVPVVVLTKADLSADPEAARDGDRVGRARRGRARHERARRRGRRAAPRLHRGSSHRGPGRPLGRREVHAHQRAPRRAAAGDARRARGRRARAAHDGRPRADPDAAAAACSSTLPGCGRSA